MKFILASSSPRRQSLLQRIRLNFDVIPPNIDESIISYDGSPIDYCSTLANLKANDISQLFKNELIIGADTIVFFDNEVLGKPENETSAIGMLNKLSGNTHQVYTSVCIKNQCKEINHTFTEITTVTFRKLKEKEIHYYINNFTPYDKAGSYGIQDWSAIFVKEIRGCYDNVVGFPVSKFYQELNKLDINLLDSIS